jgi:hypothetical protein
MARWPGRRPRLRTSNGYGSAVEMVLPFFMGKQMGKKKHDFETTNQIKLWLMIFVGMSCTSLKESGYN